MMFIGNQNDAPYSHFSIYYKALNDIFNPNQNDAPYLHFAICYRALDGVINNLLLW